MVRARRRGRARSRQATLPLVGLKPGYSTYGNKLGRPKKAKRGALHEKRPALKASQPAHVVLRAIGAIRTLRTRKIYQALRWATLAAAKWQDDFRIVHLSIQRTHVHLLVEAKDKRALARGMQSFQISAAKLINAQLELEDGTRRRGSVFPDRYHLEVITNPKQARHALAYVLNNWRKHREDGGRRWLVDPFSTGAYFDGWKELEGKDFFWRVPPTYEPMFVWLPKTWFLSEGWRRHGLIACREVPGGVM